MWSFPGLSNIYRQVVPHFARLALQLNKKMNKDEPCQHKLDDAERNAVDMLKEKLINPPVFALPRLNEQYTIHMDAWDTQVECAILRQHEDKVLKSIGC